ncbi:unnamed protein product [Litomosoides sigmodontis]|uniref:Uncharacterized protein n=1 Tax=Litomosoides sigmodontis TaxID=42156 RepID=A0A3P6SUS2_LITSI|nr:unnamed protein product [Litomosoides sigmodontis]
MEIFIHKSPPFPFNCVLYRCLAPVTDYAGLFHRHKCIFLLLRLGTPATAAASQLICSTISPRTSGGYYWFGMLDVHQISVRVRV